MNKNQIYEVRGKVSIQLSKNIITPIYSRIALDIAVRITRGELKENSKLYGRSVMASEYGVSPETIRRSMKLLEDMKVVEVKQNSGVVVLSAENARLYVDKFGEQNNLRTIYKNLNDLINEQNIISKQIADIANSIVKTNDKFIETNPFSSYEIDIPDNSHVIGHTIGELNFWQETRATIIAIRRAGSIILSPGPYALFNSKDTIVFVGEFSCVQTVNDYINK